MVHSFRLYQPTNLQQIIHPRQASDGSCIDTAVIEQPDRRQPAPGPISGLDFRALSYERHSLPERLTDQYPAKVIQGILA